MDETARHPHPIELKPAAHAAPMQDVAPSAGARVLMIGAVLVGAGAVYVLLQAVVSHDPEHKALWLQSTVAAVAVAFSGWAVYRQWRRWSQPAGLLHEMIACARSGEIPIEELSKIGGGMKPLVPVIQDLLRDVRSQHAAVASLNQEIRQRVAVRTDALERTIGSLRHQATKDGLTGLHNRRMLDESLGHLVAKCREDKAELSLVIMDVDHFKLLNDTLGHGEGDQFLKAIGQLIRSTLRVEDMGFRLGGDEFVALLPHCARKQAEEYAYRLVSLVDQLAKPLKLTRKPGISFGVASLSALPDPSVETLLRVADDALYDQKSTRRRRSTDLQNASPLLQSPASITQRS